MAKIQLLDQLTIDKIAAGEVIERPAAVVKELVENAIDAGATSIVVEIKEGGIAFIRITDNGFGIERSDIPYAFLRHSTSKIRSIDDLLLVSSLGFRGEALSSIASVAQVEVLTKQATDEVGSKYTIHGGVEVSLEDEAVNDGTTFLVRQLFYNVPARRKFLKTATTEASHVGDLVTRLALSHPSVSFQFITNGVKKLHTSGNGNLKDLIYHIYGRDIANQLLEVQESVGNLKITGYIGKPVISRGNRNYETYFINGRYVKSNTIAKAIEDAYKGYTMQHRYPFCVLHIEMDTSKIDVNVHPTKMELRFSEQHAVYNHIYETMRSALARRDLIQEVTLPIEPAVTQNSIIDKPHRNTNRYGSSLTAEQEKENLDYFLNKMEERVSSYHNRMSSAEVENKSEIFKREAPEVQHKIREAISYAKANEEMSVPTEQSVAQAKQIEIPEVVSNNQIQVVEEKQLNMFEDELLETKSIQHYRLIGQVFHTYWMIEYKEELYIIDQHAAHEKVLYEDTINNWKNKEFTTQYISPPIILSLTMQERDLLQRYRSKFTDIGFEIEEFGSDAFAIRGVPANLFSFTKKDLFLEMLDELSELQSGHIPAERITEKIASMSCKAAVKGNSNLSASEMDVLIGQLLDLENPFHCPHGRPIIISISKKEMEKKFKRIV